jgi:hypothetical protein
MRTDKFDAKREPPPPRPGGYDRRGILVLAAAMAFAATMSKAEELPVRTFAGMSDGFWKDWNGYKASPQFGALQKESGAGAAVEGAVAAGAKSNKQGIADMAVTDAAWAAGLMAGAAKLGAEAEAGKAIETVLRMRTSPKTREAAIAAAPPETRASLTQWNANLSTGVAGLPGIYLSDSPAARALAPAGYQPVAGGSAGCPAH